MLNRDTVIQWLTDNTSLSLEQAERAFDFAWREYHTYGWADVLNGLEEIVFIITGSYPPAS